MARVDDSIKQEIFAQLGKPEKPNYPELVAKYGVRLKLLYTWREMIMKQNCTSPQSSKSSAIASDKKMAAIAAKLTLDEKAFGLYCRQNGLFAKEVEEWQRQASDFFAKPKHAESLESKQKDESIRKLEKEVDRKNKALAEAAAIIVLQKKVQDILGSAEL